MRNKALSSAFLFLSFTASLFAQESSRRIVIGPADETAKSPPSGEQLLANLPSRDSRAYPLVAWDEKTAAHLMRRAAFSASPARIREVVTQGFSATLSRLLHPQLVDDSEMEGALAAKNYQLYRVNNQGRKYADAFNMRRWWLYRMANSERQLLEKMTYFWHDHFATSVVDINGVDPNDRPLMMIQNETLRAHALGNFKTMVEEIARDAAMLYWLDNVTNRVGKPNENWARELMELFTMGVDSGYTEQDIRESARAFTGWGVDRQTQTFRFFPQNHDNGEKTFLGVTGNLDGGDVINIIFQQRVAAEFIAKKLFQFLVHPNPSPALVRELGDLFRASGYDIRVLVKAIFEHPEFFSDRAYRAHIKSPVEFVVGVFRELEIREVDALPRLMNGMNQNLFAPPDVSGWVSGVGWLNTTTLLNRYNFLNYVATRRSGADRLDVNRLVEANQLKTSQDVTGYFVQLFLQNDVSLDTYYALEEYLRRDDSGNLVAFDVNDSATLDKKVRGLVYLVSILPAYQLN